MGIDGCMTNVNWMVSKFVEKMFRWFCGLLILKPPKNVTVEDWSNEHWLNVYTTNNNPRIIAGYFYESLNEENGCPENPYGDLGTENIYVKQFQLAFGKKYLDGPSSANQRIEGFLGQLRKQCAEYWMQLFHELQSDGDFTGNYLDNQLLVAAIANSLLYYYIGQTQSMFKCV